MHSIHIDGYITKQKKHSKIKNQLFMSKDLCIDFDQVIEQKDKALDYTVLQNKAIIMDSEDDFNEDVGDDDEK